MTSNKCCATNFLESRELVDRLFQSGIWHYSTFLTASASDDEKGVAKFERELACLESLNRTLPLPGAAVLEPSLEIKLLTGGSNPEGYCLAINMITARRPTIITVPQEIDDADQKWQGALSQAFDTCISRGHWLRLPEKLMQLVLAKEYNDQVIAYLKQLNLVSTNDNQPVCYVAG